MGIFDTQAFSSQQGMYVVKKNLESLSSSSTLLLAEKEGELFVLKFFTQENYAIAQREMCASAYLSQFPEANQYVSLYTDIIESDEYVCLVMPFYEGGDLWDYLFEKKNSAYNRTTRPSGKTVMKWMNIANQMMQCLKFIHSHGVYHFDVKPDNFMFVDKEQTHLILIDFGLSMFYNEKNFENVRGTKGFRSAQILANQPEKEDCFAAGIVIHLLLFGSHPFAPKMAQNYEELKKLEENIAMGNIVNKGHRDWILDTDCRDFVDLMIDYNPSNRPSLVEYCI